MSRFSRTLLPLLAIALFLSPPGAAADVIDRVVAAVGDDAITLFDIDREGGPALNQIRSAPESSERSARLYEVRKEILEKLIEKLLLSREGKRLGIEIGDAEVDAAVTNVLRENRISREELARALAGEGLTLEKYREEIRGQILRSRVIDRKVRSSVSVTDEDVRLYYEKNRGRFDDDEEMRARHILFKVPDGADDTVIEEVKRRAGEALADARAGEDFETLARTHSEGPTAPSGGDLGFFRRGDMVKEFSEAAFLLKEGEISGLVLTRFGYHIIQAVEKRGGGEATLADSQDKIRSLLFSEELERELRRFLDELKERDEVDILF